MLTKNSSFFLLNEDATLLLQDYHSYIKRNVGYTRLKLLGNVLKEQVATYSAGQFMYFVQNCSVLPLVNTLQ